MIVPCCLISFIIVIAIFLLVSSWFLTSITQDQRDCYNYDKSLEKISNYIGTIKDLYSNNGKIIATGTNNKFEDEYKNALKHYYIKTAYNCCSSYGYKNVYVNTCALRNALKQGARCLDFEIYSIDLRPVIAVSSVNNYTIKESYNYILLEKVLEFLKLTRNNSDPAYIDIQTEDPIFLHFRIKSSIPSIYEKIYDILSDYKDDLITESTYNYFSGESSEQQSWPIISLNMLQSNQSYKLANKFIIMIHNNEISKLRQSNLKLLTNIYTGPKSNNCKLMYYNDILSAGPNDQLLKEETKKNLVIVLPNKDSSVDNYDWQKYAIPLGCQFIGMKFQTSDFNFLSYLNFFKSRSNYSFVSKPPELCRYINRTAPQATPTNVLSERPWPNKTTGIIQIENTGNREITITQLKAPTAFDNINDGDVTINPNKKHEFTVNNNQASTLFQFKVTQGNVNIDNYINCIITLPQFTIVPRLNAWKDSKIIIKLKII